MKLNPEHVDYRERKLKFKLGRKPFIPELKVDGYGLATSIEIAKHEIISGTSNIQVISPRITNGREGYQLRDLFPVTGIITPFRASGLSSENLPELYWTNLTSKALSEGSYLLRYSGTRINNKDSMAYAISGNDPKAKEMLEEMLKVTDAPEDLFIFK